MAPPPLAVMVSVLLSAVSFPSAALPPELTVILRALAAVLVVVLC